jgi:DNA-binding response OmpR family regulator
MSINPPLPVLIVDDNVDLAEMVRIALTNAGIECQVAIGGTAALEYVAAHPVRMMVLDISMPDMTGWQVLETLKARYPEQQFPVMMLTAFSDPANKLIGKLQDRVAHYMVKPFHPQALVKAVKDTLEPEAVRIPA